jgi:uncharacterized membrane protein YGL010W
MKSLVEHLSAYASYHRDRRNVATHFVGIPLIVVGVEAFLARASVDVTRGVRVSLASVATAVAVAFYLALDRRFGLTMAALLVLALAAGGEIASQATAVWLLVAAALFVGGWAAQFVGHVFEGRKPAFVDDLAGLLVGPLFLVAEAAFALGWRSDVHAAILRRLAVRSVRSSPQNALP